MIIITCLSIHSYYIFFFSSRRRHTRCSRDWSSDVCSSDLHELRHQVFFKQPFTAARPGVVAAMARVKDHDRQGRAGLSCGKLFSRGRRELLRSGCLSGSPCLLRGRRRGLQHIRQQHFAAFGEDRIKIETALRRREDELRHAVLVVKTELADVGGVKLESLLERLEGPLPPKHHPHSGLRGSAHREL